MTEGMRSTLTGWLAAALCAGVCGCSSEPAGTRGDVGRITSQALASTGNWIFQYLEQRGFCNNGASCWSSCSTSGYNSSNCGTYLNGAPAPTIQSSWSWPCPSNAGGCGGNSDAADMWLGNTTDDGYGDAYWYTQLSTSVSSSLSNFMYSTDVYVGNAPGTYQAVEWDGNYYGGGYHYIFGLQADAGDTHTWRYFRPNVGWQSTNIGLPNLSGTWTTVQAVWQIQGGGCGNLYSFSVGGSTYYGNGAWSYCTASTTSSNGTTMGVQGDENTNGMSVFYSDVAVNYY